MKFLNALPLVVSLAPTAPPARVATAAPANQHWYFWGSALFLVSVPVFFQAPLVREWPHLSLALSALWFWLGDRLYRNPQRQIWGDLLLGFGWSWLAGSLYWGWLRWEPLLHLPVEAIGLPIALWGLRSGWGRIGHWFYLGSLLGTCITDGYFYLIDVIPHWRRIMLATPTEVPSIFQEALLHLRTPWGVTWAIALALLLLAIARLPQSRSDLHRWTFSGTIVGTLLVDALFGLAASL